MLHDPQEGDGLIRPCSILALSALTGKPAPDLLDKYGGLLSKKGGATYQAMLTMLMGEGFDFETVEYKGTLGRWLREHKQRSEALFLVVVTKHALVVQGPHIACYHVREVKLINDWCRWSMHVDRTRVQWVWRLFKWREPNKEGRHD